MAHETNQSSSTVPPLAIIRTLCCCIFGYLPVRRRFSSIHEMARAGARKPAGHVRLLHLPTFSGAAVSYSAKTGLRTAWRWAALMTAGHFYSSGGPEYRLTFSAFFIRLPGLALLPQPIR
jgi:hypothetical protein